MEVNKETFLSSIAPDMRLTQDFFKRIYGFEISFPGFADEAIEKLEAAGCSQARRYYTEWVQAYKEEQQATLKSVAEWYRRRCEDEWNARLKGGGAIWTQQQDLQQMSNTDLITLLENLLGVT